MPRPLSVLSVVVNPKVSGILLDEPDAPDLELWPLGGSARRGLSPHRHKYIEGMPALDGFFSIAFAKLNSQSKVALERYSRDVAGEHWHRSSMLLTVCKLSFDVWKDLVAEVFTREKAFID